MPCEAYFIGGQEDLTKRVLEEALPYYIVYRKPKHVSVSSANFEDLVQCEEIKYTLQTMTRGSVYIYEYDGD